jgi:hypothetical protein
LPWPLLRLQVENWQPPPPESFTLPTHLTIIPAYPSAGQLHELFGKKEAKNWLEFTSWSQRARELASLTATYWPGHDDRQQQAGHH